MTSAIRNNGEMSLVVNRLGLHEDDGDLSYWMGIEPSERVAAVEVLRQRVFGGTDETRQGLQRVCRIIRR